MIRFFIFSLFVVFNVFSAKGQESGEQSPYVFLNFMQGTMHKEDGEKVERNFNYNGVTEEMIFENAGRRFALDNLDQIDKVVFEEHIFIPFGDKFYEKRGEASKGPFIRYEYRIEAPNSPSAYGGSNQTTATTNYSSLSDEKMLYKLKLPDEYDIAKKRTFYFLVEGELEKVSNRRQARRIDRDRKSEIKQFIKDNNIDFSSVSDMIKLGEFYESLE